MSMSTPAKRPSQTLQSGLYSLPQQLELLITQSFHILGANSVKFPGVHHSIHPPFVCPQASILEHHLDMPLCRSRAKSPPRGSPRNLRLRQGFNGNEKFSEV